jgi:hypothetical protein
MDEQQRIARTRFEVAQRSPVECHSPAHAGRLIITITRTQAEAA